ncbi:PAS domain-containing sensor histidine kinase [Paraburkholderia phenoliruptrix]|uniref:PAS domain-containing sensor histidine kinase n=1 Tax=Paraburkholderia phenoliruptrix TaxID=252970 RepID=UPI001C6EEFCB|nr:PAS domain-containing sensor histidine kinase [Paraburkholderia phenoliruptrix]MBW9102346.1 PAS domain S-box protein [Paraburkholderia phenoliruptrix]MBW9127567.1 PAS domain S-box protein [Paraburkholderia ginsengiterrae]
MSQNDNRQDATRETEEQFRILVQGVTDYAIFMLSPAGVVTSWNVGAERIKGYRQAEIVGEHFSRFYSDEDKAAGVPALILATAAKEGRAEREGWRVRKDGSRFWAHVVVDAIRDEAGSLVGFAKVTRDITERKQAAAALEKANAALFQAQKMEAIGRLTGGVAHDFNNLLAVLSNGLEVLAIQSRTRIERKMIEGMRRAIDRGASLTQQLLSFARQQPLQAQVHDLNALIREFAPMLSRARNRNTKVELALQPGDTFALVDAARFEAALLNLVVNAVDAMPTGGTVTIGTGTVQSDADLPPGLAGGRYVRISVVDTGTGMPADVLAQAFEPFFTTKQPGKGTGLGLSQVYGFIAQSGGDVHLSSEVGKGTKVDLYLPLAQPEAAVSAPQVAKHETVLLVDDEPDVLGVASELLMSIGYEVVPASSASEAAQILRERTDIAVVFTDITMAHGISGLELARLVRTEYPAIRVVLTSGYSAAPLRDERNGLGDVIFVQKPYRLADLAKALRA